MKKRSGKTPELRTNHAATGLKLYNWSPYKKSPFMQVRVEQDLDKAGQAFAVQILRALQFWHKQPQIVIQLCTGESPFIGYRKIGGDKFLKQKGLYNPHGKFESILDCWDKPKTRAFLTKNGLNPKLKPDMNKVIAFAIDAIFPQRAGDYFAFANLLNNVCDLWNIPDKNRNLFYGDIHTAKQDGQWRVTKIPHTEYEEIIDSINREGLKILEYQAMCLLNNIKAGFALNSSLQLKNGRVFGNRLSRADSGDFLAGEHEIAPLGQGHIQYRYLEGMRNQALLMNEKLLSFGGAHITLLGVGPSYEGEGHIGFCEKGTPFKQTCFIGAINDYDATFHISGTHAKEFNGFKNMFVTHNNIRMPKSGFITFGPVEMLYRDQEAKHVLNKIGIPQDVIVIAAGNLKSSSVARAIEGGYNLDCPLSLTQNCQGVYVLDKTSARQLHIDRQPGDNRPKGISSNIIRPNQIVEELSSWSVRPGDSILLINPHMDDEFLSMMHLLKQMALDYNIHACYTCLGYTAVYSDYILGLLEIAGSLNQDEMANLSPELKQGLLKQLIKEKETRKRIPELDYEVLPFMSKGEKELRARLLLIDLNQRYDFRSTSDITRLRDFLSGVERSKTQGGCVDIEIMRYLKTSARFMEAASSLMWLGVSYKNIYWPLEVSFYGTLGRPLAIKQEDINKIKTIIKAARPKMVIFNGEGFPDFGAHSNTEIGTYIALFELSKQGAIKDDILLFQWAGVWDRIGLSESQLSAILTRQELQDFYNAFNFFYPTQAPYAPILNASSVCPQSFARDVIVNARQSGGELSILKDIPDNISGMLKQEAGVLSYKLRKLKNPMTKRDFLRKKDELGRLRLSIDISSNAALIGPEPYPERLNGLSSTLVSDMYKRKAISETERDLFGYGNSFCLSDEDMVEVVNEFHKQMGRGLKQEESSLAMLPTFIGNITGKEKGAFLALDLGGSTLRVLMVELAGSNRKPRVIIEKYNLKASDEERRKAIGYDYTRLSANEFFAAITRYISMFLAKHRRCIIKCGRKPYNLGFTFSFSITKTAIDRALVNKLSKEFDIPDLINRDVVRFLREAIADAGLGGILKVVSLNNDAVATLVARRYRDTDCDIGGIVGTGTNFCYLESTENIAKLKGGQKSGYNRQGMIVNIESGNFNRITQNAYDRLLDENSINSGEHMTEKMVSGLYLGELTRLVLLDYINKGFLFKGGLTDEQTAKISRKGSFQSPFMSSIAEDKTTSLKKVGTQLIQWGARQEHISLEDKRIVKGVCRAVDRRAARITAAIVFSIVTHIDREIRRRHTVAIDGSVFEKHIGFKKDMQLAIKALSMATFKDDRSDKISLELTTGGSGIGAAIIAATAI